MNFKQFSVIINLVFPPYCLSCKKKGEYLCINCKNNLVSHPEICPSCHTPTRHGVRCFLCTEKSNSALAGIIIPFRYTSAIKKCIYAVKFYHRYDVADFLAKRLVLHIQAHELFQDHQNNTMLTRVPSHRTRHLFQKGYNQSKILTLTTAKLLGIPARELSIKTKRTSSQITLNRVDRLQNLLDAFLSTNEPIPSHISKIIIIDDITTTGSTLEQVARSIHIQHPFLEIWGCVVARHI